MAPKQLSEEGLVKKPFSGSFKEAQSELLRHSKKCGVDISDSRSERAAVLGKALKNPKAKDTLGRAVGNILGGIRGAKKR